MFKDSALLSHTIKSFSYVVSEILVKNETFKRKIKECFSVAPDGTFSGKHKPFPAELIDFSRELASSGGDLQSNNFLLSIHTMSFVLLSFAMASWNWDGH